jgi:thymidylate kinase
MIVLADRHAYTAFARDATRGVDRRRVRDLYSLAVRPVLAICFRVPIRVVLSSGCHIQTSARPYHALSTRAVVRTHIKNFYSEVFRHRPWDSDNLRDHEPAVLGQFLRRFRLPE